MTLLYAGYLALALGGAFLLMHLFRITFSVYQTNAIAIALTLTAFAFAMWDILAVMRGHWSFDFSHTLGMLIFNQPAEEVIFFVVMPFLGIVLYEIFKKKGEKRK